MKPAIMLIAALVMLVPLGAEASPEDKDRWNEKYATARYIFGKEPIPFLKQHVDLLPKGTALDIAMGEGRSGVFLR